MYFICISQKNKDINNNTPLQYSAKMNNEIATAFLRSKSKVHAISDDGDTDDDDDDDNIYYNHVINHFVRWSFPEVTNSSSNE